MKKWSKKDNLWVEIRTFNGRREAILLMQQVTFLQGLSNKKQEVNEIEKITGRFRGTNRNEEKKEKDRRE